MSLLENAEAAEASDLQLAELEEWKARAEKAERERDVAISMSLKRSNDLAAAQARERELRSALRLADTILRRKYEYSSEFAPISAALSAPQDTTALREFGLKVARRAITPTKRDEFGLPVGETAEAVVDAVLKGAE